MPTEVAVLRGVRSSRINTERAEPRDAAPLMPEGLSDGAREEWSRILPDLLVMRSAKSVDAAALAAYCESVAVFYRLSTSVDIDGPILDDATEYARRNPALTAFFEASREIRAWAREFGFTPSARTPIKVEHKHSVSGADRLLSQ